ncbi:transposase domain-containing protein [Pasteurella multocida]|uniref:transposase domain-containing protein n=1 Tax=Pasteurella multocida TaxID=747 RepID=UPI0029AC3BBC|nr:transposase domain-containing protein [Pasteurella multocida]MDX3890563.1 transposase domain-containing protein [Pasteurella multocida]
MKEWFLSKDIAGISGLPSSPNSVTRLATQKGWTKRQVQGARGVTFEYHISSLPPETQQQIKLKAALAALPQKEVVEKKPDADLMQRFNQATDAAREKAKSKAEAVLKLQSCLDLGIPLKQAIPLVAEQKEVSPGSLKNWYYKVCGNPVHEWQALLISGSGKAEKSHKKAFIEQEAWEVFLSDYLRPEEPELRACYRRTAKLAQFYGWQMASLQTFQRKLVKEIPYEVILLKRKGANAVAKLVPALRRTVKDIQAMEWINGDGYQHNVFVKFPNGEIHRPKTWFWQDVRTRKILGYRTAISENTDSIRLALMEVIYKYGIPRTLTLDNTRAAANKVMTGGIENRYRFKHDELDPKGIMPILGIDVHFTSILYGEGHGQAKPIERAFGRGGIGEIVDKRPELSGFYTGKRVDLKPDNYNGGKDGVAYEVFLQALAAGVASYNNQTDRKTELCQHDKELSFDKVWERDYAPSNVRQASQDQLRILFLQSESVRIKKNGEFTLKAAGKLLGLTNIYWAQDLFGIEAKRVVVRFDPDNLHSNVYVYDLEGRFLAEAICREAKGYGDTRAAREQGRYYKQIVTSAKKQAESLELLTAHELANLQPQMEVEQPIEEQVKESLMEKAIRTQIVPDHNALRVVEMEEETEEVSEFEKAFQRGVAKLKQTKG